MNIKRVVTFVVLFLLTVTFTTTRSSSALTPGDKRSIFGEGTFSFLNFASPPFTEHVAFSFSATMNENGNGKGRATFDYLTTQTRVVVKIDCAAISTAEAIMTGRVQHSDDPDFPKGVQVVFAAIDGSKIPVPFSDRITPIFTFPFEFDCTDGVSPLTILVPEGDIVIEP
jgi:hypothetical protein